jgi:hypothetical protein
MNNLRPIDTSDLVAIATAAAALALPPTGYGLVPDAWAAGDRVVPELELELWTDSAAVAVTSAVLYGATLHPLALGNQALTSASSSTNKFTLNTHHRLTGDGPFTLTNVGGAVPGGSALATPYWLVVDSANTFLLATSFANALAGVTVDLTTNGTGTTTLNEGASTQRVHWQTHDGLLGLAGDGAIALTNQVGYRKRVPHSPRVFAYALVGTLDTGTVSAALVPIRDAG